MAYLLSVPPPMAKKAVLVQKTMALGGSLLEPNAALSIFKVLAGNCLRYLGLLARFGLALAAS